MVGTKTAFKQWVVLTKTITSLLVKEERRILEDNRKDRVS
jgi:hypothetical protein